MTLILKDRVFDIRCATLSAILPARSWSRKDNTWEDAILFWDLTIEADQREFNEERWEPKIYHDNLRFPIRHWKEIAGQAITWNSPCDETTGEPNGGIYVFEHDDILRATLRFIAREGLRFHFKWDGVCWIFWGEDEPVPFTVEGWATFTEVRVNGLENDTDDSMRTRLAKYLDPEGFIQHPIQYKTFSPENRTIISYSIFRPIDK